MKIASTLKQAHKHFKSLLVTGLVFCVFNAHGAEYQYTYPVTGSNAAELINQIQRNSHSPDGAFGYTKLNTNVGWTALVDGEGICTIETVNFSYDITIYMPDWIEKHTAKQCLQDNWNSVWLKIQVHEERHRDIYRLLDVDDIEQRIRSIKPKNSCDALKFAVNQEVEKILDANDKLHDMFHAADTPPVLWEC